MFTYFAWGCRDCGQPGLPELRSRSVKVEEAVMGSPSLIVLMAFQPRREATLNLKKSGLTQLGPSEDLPDRHTQHGHRSADSIGWAHFPVSHAPPVC